MKTAKLISWVWCAVAIALTIMAFAKSSFAFFIPAFFSYMMFRLIGGAIGKIEEAREK